MKLTDKQQKAVTSVGSVAVTAGAGTGKTAMLAERFLHHITNDGFSPLEVVAVTFTEKAAAELRSRIRIALSDRAGSGAAAEADAAQISTIHSLAARICRDFYDIAAIPPDFRVLDEIGTEILIASWFDGAMETIDQDIVRELGYTWLRSALRCLLNDPSAAVNALGKCEADWRSHIETVRDGTLAELMASECWRETIDVLPRFSGSNGDKLEPHRAAAVEAMKEIAAGRNIAEAVAAILSVKINVGSQSNWPDGSMPRIKDRLRALREAVGNDGVFGAIAYEFGEADKEACRRVKLLRTAFGTVQRYFGRARLEKGVLDFTDLEQYAIKALECSEVRDHYAGRWKAILVDEFQDTNPDQERLLDLLTSSGMRLTIVGDSKQSVYGFRRADPRVFDRFRRKIGNEVVLDRTFRSHAGLVEHQNSFFVELLGEQHQPLMPERMTHPHAGPFITAHIVEGEGDADILRRKEAVFIANAIADLLQRGLPIWDKESDSLRQVRVSDIAVLSRTRAPLDIYIDELINAGIPAVNTGGGDLLETRVAKDMSAILRFAADPSDDVAAVALLRSPFFGVSDIELQQLSARREPDETWWDLLKKGDGELARARTILAEILVAAKRVSAERLLSITDEKTGYTAVIANLEQGSRRMADWFGFLSLLRKFAAMGRSDVIGADRYLRELRRAESLIPRPPVDAGDAVSLMTIHAAKGLEWPIVFIPNLCAAKRSDSSPVLFDAEVGVAFKLTMQTRDGKLGKVEPNLLKLIRKRRSRLDSAESARILYVAITRGRDRVYLSAAGGNRNDLDILRSRLDSAGIGIETTPEVERRFVTGTTGLLLADPKKIEVQVNEVVNQVSRVPMSGLGDYAACPKQFRLRHLDGHPGLPDGGDAGRVTGMLTHLALELDLATAEALRPLADGAADELTIEAARLASVFNRSKSFSEFRIENSLREVPVNFEFGGIELSGKADLVGSDWVLDFKTDSEMDPDRHLLQLWAYARGLSKRRAVVAYLRHERVHEFCSDDMAMAEPLAEEVVNGIRSGRFDPTPSVTTCAKCEYAVICDEAIKAPVRYVSQGVQ